VAGAADERFGVGCQFLSAQPWCGSARVVDQDFQVPVFVAYPGGRRLDAVVVSRSMWMKVTPSLRAASVPRCEDGTAQARALAALSSVAMARPAPLSRTAAAR
jgi:hypothetical protein